MSRRLLATAAALAFGASLWGMVPSGAGLNPATMTISPEEGPPGTVITVNGTGCTDADDTIVDVSLFDDVNHSKVESKQATPVGGAWSATLTVPAETTDYGAWRVSALCSAVVPDVPVKQAVPSATEELFEYEDAPFTVLAPTPDPEPTPEPPAALPVAQEAPFTG